MSKNEKSGRTLLNETTKKLASPLDGTSLFSGAAIKLLTKACLSDGKLFLTKTKK